MNPVKSPSLNGFNAAFYEKSWYILGARIIEGVISFFKLGKEVNHTFLTLILKVINYSQLADFMSISCCNIYTRLSQKSLAIDSKLSSVISSLQTSVHFLKEGKLVTTLYWHMS